MTISYMYVLFCTIIVSVMALVGILFCVSHFIIWTIEQTMRHFRVYNGFVDWVMEKYNKESE